MADSAVVDLGDFTAKYESRCNNEKMNGRWFWEGGAVDPIQQRVFYKQHGLYQVTQKNLDGTWNVYEGEMSRGTIVRSEELKGRVLTVREALARLFKLFNDALRKIASGKKNSAFLS